MKCFSLMGINRPLSVASATIDLSVVCEFVSCCIASTCVPVVPVWCSKQVKHILDRVQLKAAQPSGMPTALQM